MVGPDWDVSLFFSDFSATMWLHSPNILNSSAFIEGVLILMTLKTYSIFKSFVKLKLKLTSIGVCSSSIFIEES